MIVDAGALLRTIIRVCRAGILVHLGKVYRIGLFVVLLRGVDGDSYRTPSVLYRLIHASP